jgi:hypothetical protein
LDEKIKFLNLGDWKKTSRFKLEITTKIPQKSRGEGRMSIKGYPGPGKR